MKKLSFLLIDDEKEYCRTLKTNAYQIGLDNGFEIHVTDSQNWEDGKSRLEEMYFDAVIFDAKCMVRREQETEDFEFLAIALDDLAILESTYNRTIPFAVNTGYFGEKETTTMNGLVKKRRSKIFSKAASKESLIDYLINQIGNAPATKIERDFSEVFEVFDLGYLDSSLKADLLDVLACVDDPTNVKNNFNRLRKILEAVYKRLGEIGYLPDSVFHPDGRPNLTSVGFFLRGFTKYPTPATNPEPINEAHYLTCVEFVTGVTSQLSHHTSYYRHDVSINAYRGTTFALFEIMLWFKRLMKRRT